jgi:hypothetical protein
VKRRRSPAINPLPTANALKVFVHRADVELARHAGRWTWVSIETLAVTGESLPPKRLRYVEDCMTPRRPRLTQARVDEAQGRVLRLTTCHGDR